MEILDPQPGKPPGAGPSAPPPAVVLLLLLISILFGSLLGSGLVIGLSSAQGTDLRALMDSLDASAPLATRNFIRLANFINHLLTFSVPALAVAWFVYRRRWFRELRLDRRPWLATVGVSILFILAAFPLAQFTYWLNQQIPIPEWAQRMESSAEGMLQGLLTMESPWELAFNLLIVAVLPGIGEELVFRGIVQQQLRRAMGNAIPAIWITAIIFSAIHLQFEGFIPRLVLGAALGYLFYWTRNLWIPVIAHFFFNGSQIIAQYATRGQLGQLEGEQLEQMPAPWGAALFSSVILIALGYYLCERHKAQAD